MITFNTDGMVAQRFAFPAPNMNYIFENLRPEHLLKLYKTCKIFYAKYRLNIIRHLELVDDDVPEKFDPTNTIIHASNPSLKKLKDFWLADSFIYRAKLCDDPFPDFSHCTIKKLELCGTVLWDAFEVLTKAGTVEDLKITGIYDEDGFVCIEKLIAQVPNAASIEISESQITPTTFTSLLTLEHKAKIVKFVLENVVNARFCQIRLFVDFILKNATNDCNIRIKFYLFPEINDAIREHNDILKKLEVECAELIAETLDLKMEMDAADDMKEIHTFDEMKQIIMEKMDSESSAFMP